MKLKRFEYSEGTDGGGSWTLAPFDVADINLIVGRNATGKTRTLNVISNFALLVCGERVVALGKNPGNAISNGVFKSVFDDNGTKVSYSMTLKGIQYM